MFNDKKYKVKMKSCHENVKISPFEPRSIDF